MSAARPYDHLNLKSQSYHCYRDPQTPRPTAPASSTDEETYEEVSDDPKAQVTAYEGKGHFPLRKLSLVQYVLILFLQYLALEHILFLIVVCENN